MDIKLNLIPDSRKAEINQTTRLSKILQWETSIVAIIIIFFAILVSLNYIVKINLTAAKNNFELGIFKDQYDKLGKYGQAVKDINSQLAVADKIQGDQLYWSKILIKISELVIPGVEVDGLSNNNYTINLIGKADNRDNLLKFESKIESEDCFTDVNLPLSDLVTKENVDFQMNFNVKEECLKANR